VSIDPATGALTLDYAADRSGTAQLTVRATDSGGLFVESTFTVTVNPVNDAPVNHFADPQFADPRSAVVFGADTGNAITVSDVDADRGQLLVTLRAERGYTLRLGNAERVTVLEERPDLLQFEGRLVDVNAALDGLSLASEERRDVTTLTITTDDQGATGAGGALSDTDVITVVYNADPPRLSVGNVFVTEGHFGTTSAVFVVTYTGTPGRDQPVRVNYTTADGTATAASGDYVPASGLLEFRDGATEATITVSVNGDIDPEQLETFFLNLSAPQNAIIDDAQAIGTIFNDDVPPRVMAVWFNGTGWTQAFRNGLAASGLGDPALGFDIPGADQYFPLSWEGINQVSMRFFRDVIVAQGDLEIRGTAVARYATSGMTYNPTTFTATWTLAQPLRNDKLLLDLNGDPGGVRTPAGLRLDGEWGGVGFPSGDGVQGDDFKFRFNVLTGDANRDGRVNATDLLDVRRRLRRSTSNPGSGAAAYNPFRDPTADGRINAADEALVRRHGGRVLPTGEPAASAPTFFTPRKRTAPITRSLFTDSPIVL
jgi:hypothetical protein